MTSAMCYLCDLCAKYQRVPGFDICYGAAKKFGEKQKKAIDYGRDDPKAICEHFEPKCKHFEPKEVRDD